MQAKPFALIGVNINCHDPKKLKEVMDKEQLNFRSFTDTADGEGLGVLSSAWNLMGTPTLFVLDHKGVIRYSRRGVPDAKVIDEVLNKLIKEAEGNDKEVK
jgi:peroxiredoxin